MKYIKWGKGVQGTWKPIRGIKNVSIIPVVGGFLDKSLDGKFVATGTTVYDDDRFISGADIRTSLIVNIDIKHGVIETMNTLYRIV